MKLNNPFLRTFFVFALVVVLGTSLMASRAGAQTISGSGGSSVPCTVLNYNLRIGNFDQNAVIALQVFLVDEGYLAHVPTGYFGSLTYQAVVNFQATHGVSATGFVGPITRGLIQAMSCGAPAPEPLPTPSNVLIYNISPASGPTGTVITITGRGFTSSNTVFFDGGAVPNIPSGPGIAIACTIDPNCIPGIRQVISFTVPAYIGPYCPPGALCAQYLRQITPGTYDLHVGNDNGTSNNMSFTVTSTNGGPLSISGIDAPNSLPINTPGTWAVHVSSSVASTLHYSVVWGDENSASGFMAPQSTNMQTSASFTHVYTRTGTFNPTFIVTDDFGHSANTSASIVVTPLY